MNPLIPYIAILGVEAVIKIINAYKVSGEPTDDQIRALKIPDDPKPGRQ